MEDAYLFGSDMYVAPLMENGKGRTVYLPGKSQWIDYQTGKSYAPGWNTIDAGTIPCIILVREGALIPHATLAQSTDKMDWNNITLQVYGNSPTAKGLFCLPTDNKLIELEATKTGNSYQLVKGNVNSVVMKCVQVK